MIYFIQAGENGPIKIGVAGRVRLKERLHSIQTCNYEKVELLKAIDGNHSRECSIHAFFKDIRIRGEWFKPTNELLDFIQNPKRLPGTKKKRKKRKKRVPMYSVPMPKIKNVQEKLTIILDIPYYRSERVI